MKQSGSDFRKFTKSLIDSLEYPSDYEKRKPFVVWGGEKETAGLGVRVTPNGVKSFVVQYRCKKRFRIMTLGRFGDDLTLHKARIKAARVREKARDGIDSLDEQKAEVAAARAERDKAKSVGGQIPATLGELCDKWLGTIEARNKRSRGEDVRRIKKWVKGENLFKGNSIPLADVRLENVNRRVISTLYRHIGDPSKEGGGTVDGKPVEANRVLFLLATVCSWGIEQGLLSGPNPAHRKKKERYKETERDVIVKREEMPRLIDAIDQEADPYVRGLYRLLLLSGLRRSEAIEAKWQEYDAVQGELGLPDTKAGKPRRVSLSPASVAELGALPRSVSPYIFPAHRIDRATGRVEYSPPRPPALGQEPQWRFMSVPNRQWSRIRRRAGVEHLTGHDLRRTVSEIVVEQLRDPKAASAVLGHASMETTMKVYRAITDREKAREGVEVVATVWGIES